MRWIVLLLVSLAVASAASAAVTFLQPLAGSQAIGPQLIEVTTDIPKVDRVEFSVDGALAGVARTPPYRVAFDFGTSLTARRLSATVWSNGFQRSEQATVLTAGMSASDTLHVDLVELPVRVRSSSPLKATDVRVRENGVEQRVREVRAERPPAHFAFVIDRSSSMGDGKLDAALSAVRSQTGQLRPGDSASLVLFNHHVERPRDLKETFEVRPSGGTSLRDALASIASRQRTYAIVITDGGDRSSALSDDAALQSISGARIIVSAIVLGGSHAEFLDRAASNTGGSVTAATRETVARELQRVLADINSRYLIVYQSAGTRRGWRRIDVQSRRRGASVIKARKEYYAE